VWQPVRHSGRQERVSTFGPKWQVEVASVLAQSGGSATQTRTKEPYRSGAVRGRDAVARITGMTADLEPGWCGLT
jgi:hypothetical protein